MRVLCSAGQILAFVGGCLLIFDIFGERLNRWEKVVANRLRAVDRRRILQLKDDTAFRVAGFWCSVLILVGAVYFRLISEAARNVVIGLLLGLFLVWCFLQKVEGPEQASAYNQARRELVKLWSNIERLEKEGKWIQVVVSHLFGETALMFLIPIVFLAHAISLSYVLLLSSFGVAALLGVTMILWVSALPFRGTLYIKERYRLPSFFRLFGAGLWLIGAATSVWCTMRTPPPAGS